MIITLAALNTASAQDWNWTMPKIQLPSTHPQIACTAEELARLKAAYASQGPDHDVVAAVVTRAEQALAQPLTFPPRGGQHNQWYQCEPCQIGLVTVDNTHHKCPACGKIYTGAPYDDVIFERQHYANLRNLSAVAWAYAITGRKEFADFAAKILLGYADRYEKYPFHSNNLTQDKSGGHIFEQTLNEAQFLATEIGPAWDLVRDSDAFTPQERQAVRTGLLLPMLQTIAGNRAGKNNWQTWHNAAAGSETLGAAGANCLHFLCRSAGLQLDDRWSHFAGCSGTSIPSFFCICRSCSASRRALISGSTNSPFCIFSYALQAPAKEFCQGSSFLKGTYASENARLPSE